MPDAFHHFLESARDVAATLSPSVLGSAVAQAYQRGLNWRDRLVQWAVGILVSHFVTRALAAWLGWQIEVTQGIGFVLGVIAFQATPKFIESGSNAVAAIPNIIKKRLGGE